MQTFASPRDAKEFLISRIIAEAEREGVSLSEIERKMLYFSETVWTLPDMKQVNVEFDRNYDQEEYEQKIGTLSRNFLAYAGKKNPGELEEWEAAVRTLRQEDHYLLVLIDSRGGSTAKSDGSLTTRVAIVVVVVGLALVALYILLLR
jgi:cytochrome c-type biogenesis protein CcmH/NrfG